LIILKIILIPVSVIYSFIVTIRNKLYDIGIFKSKKISKPVISIGNISTGGTGKTPLTIHIAKYLLDRNVIVGIISRGYKRKSKEIIIVSDGENINRNVWESGDELIMISEELINKYKNKFCIAAGADRIEAGELLINKFNPDIIILDDGFQHRRINRDLDIVIIDAADYLVNAINNIFTLPSGNLRESFANTGRADLIVQNNKADSTDELSFLSYKNSSILQMRYKTEYFIDNKNSILEKTENSVKKAIVFSGIANDDSFLKMIKEEGIEIISNKKFSDHYEYKDEDIEYLSSQIKAGMIFITTEKDFVKVKQFSDFINKYPVYFLKIKIEISKNENLLNNHLEKFIK